MENLESIKETKFIKAENTALVVIDLQVGIVNREASHFTCREVVQNTSKLVNAFTEKGAFVVLVKVSSVDGTDTNWSSNSQMPADWSELVPEL